MIDINKENTKTYFSICLKSIGICFVICLVIWGLVAVSKQYNVWAEAKEGQAELAKAEYNRQIKTLEAKATEESAKHLAQAEIIRASGVAKANEIIGVSLKQNEAYLRYLWISGLQHANSQVVYVPTEANLPILEASRNK